MQPKQWCFHGSAWVTFEVSRVNHNWEMNRPRKKFKEYFFCPLQGEWWIGIKGYRGMWKDNSHQGNFDKNNQVFIKATYRSQMEGRIATEQCLKLGA